MSKFPFSTHTEWLASSSICVKILKSNLQSYYFKCDRHRMSVRVMLNVLASSLTKVFLLTLLVSITSDYIRYSNACCHSACCRSACCRILLTILSLQMLDISGCLLYRGLLESVSLMPNLTCLVLHHVFPYAFNLRNYVPQLSTLKKLRFVHEAALV